MNLTELPVNGASSSALNITSFLHEVFSDVLNPGGSLLLQTRQHNKDRQNLLTISESKLDTREMQAGLNRTWNILASSHLCSFASKTTGYPTGIWSATHDVWVMVAQCDTGEFWFSYKPAPTPPAWLEAIGSGLSHGALVLLYMLRALASRNSSDVKLQKGLHILEDTENYFSEELKATKHIFGSSRSEDTLLFVS